MAIEPLSIASTPWRVSTYVPNEVEGQILGGTFRHYTLTQQICAALARHATEQGHTWVVRGETQIIYPRAKGSDGSFYPDVLVAWDLTIADMDPYVLARVGKPPELVIEIVSRKTGRKDRTTKPIAYAEMGVQELVTFDPRPRKRMELHDYRLIGYQRYAPIAPAAAGGFWLASVGLRAVAEAPAIKGNSPMLRFYTADGLRLPLLGEVIDELAAEARAEHDGRERAEATARTEREGRVAEREARGRAEADAVAAREARERAEASARTERDIRECTERERDAALARLAELEARTRRDGDAGSDPT